jgi:hypothetical protein
MPCGEAVRIGPVLNVEDWERGRTDALSLREQ